MFRVALGWVIEAVFLGCQDISPSVDEQVLFSLKLLLFLFQAPCRGYELKLEALLLERILRHDEVFVVEACLLLGGRTVTIILRVIFYGLFVRVVLPAVVFLFGCSPGGVFTIFGVARSTIFSGASVAVLWAAGLGTAFGPPALGLCLGGFVHIRLFFVVARSFRCINHVHVI